MLILQSADVVVFQWAVDLSTCCEFVLARLAHDLNGIMGPEQLPSQHRLAQILGRGTIYSTLPYEHVDQSNLDFLYERGPVTPLSKFSLLQVETLRV